MATDIKITMAARLGGCCRSEGYKAEEVGIDPLSLLLLLAPILKAFLEQCGGTERVQRLASRGGPLIRMLAENKIAPALAKKFGMTEKDARAFFKTGKLTKVALNAVAESSEDELTEAAAIK